MSSNTSLVPCPQCAIKNLPNASTCVGCDISLVARHQPSNSNNGPTTALATTMNDIDYQIALSLSQNEEKPAAPLFYMVTCPDPRCRYENLPGATVCVECRKLMKNDNEEEIQNEEEKAALMVHTNMQALLMDGTTHIPDTPLYYIYQRAEIIMNATKEMADTIESSQVCKVVSMISYDVLIRCLGLLDQERKRARQTEDLELGFLLTSQPAQDILQQKLTKISKLVLPKKEKGGRQLNPYPSRQLNLCKSIQTVPTYVWLVLLDQSTLNLPTASKSSLDWEETESSLFCRYGIGSKFRMLRSITTYTCLNGNNSVIPLICTENWQYWRPDECNTSTLAATKPAAETETATGATSPPKKTPTNNEKEAYIAYHRACNKMKDFVCFKPAIGTGYLGARIAKRFGKNKNRNIYFGTVTRHFPNEVPSLIYVEYDDGDDEDMDEDEFNQCLNLYRRHKSKDPEKMEQEKRGRSSSSSSQKGKKRKT